MEVEINKCKNKFTEDFVSFETAKLLKEKGFGAECDCFYVNGKLVRAQGGACNWNYGETLYADYKNECSAPTIQMAMKWLREVHSIHIILDIHWLYFANTLGWMYTINKIHENGTDYIDSKGDENDKNFYSTYEEACEAAIKYCLENLI